MKKYVLSLVATPALAAAGLFALTGCFGRAADDASGVGVSPALALTQGNRSVVVFGATWCKPCRKEIADLNQARRDFRDALDIVGVLVEGDVKGSEPSAESESTFRAPSGEVPTYPLRRDPGWKAFDAMNPPDGRALPLIALVNESGRVERLVQTSLVYESELRPLLDAFAAGRANADGKAKPPNATATRPPGTPGSPTSPPLVVSAPRSLSIANWLREEMAANATSDRPLRMQNAWERGLGEFGFTQADMPFDKGRATLETDAASSRSFVSKAVWTSATNCILTLSLDVEGNFLSARGVCR